jgi:hypothetical protein
MISEAWTVASCIVLEAVASKCEPTVNTLSRANGGVLGLFHLVWFIMGNIWYYGDTSCSDFEEGSVLTLVILILYYIAFALAFCAICCLCCFMCCAGGAMLSGAAAAASAQDNAGGDAGPSDTPDNAE